MKVKVGWLGFHDGAYHESDIFESKDEVDEFIELLGDPESSTIYIIRVSDKIALTYGDYLNTLSLEEEEVKR